MAIEKHGAEMLALLRREGYSMENFVMLGRQNLDLKWRDAARLAGAFGIETRDLLVGDPDERFAEPLLQRLGARKIDSIDFSDYEGATIVHDLNKPVPEELDEKFDVVYDGGTLEHLFEFSEAIRSGMRMVKPGGLYVACTPANGFCGHGFYQFSPELYFRLFDEANGFRIRLIGFGESRYGGKVFGIRDPRETGIRAGISSHRATFLLCIAEKKNADDFTIVQPPVQSGYLNMWRASDPESVSSESASSPSLLRKSRELLRSLVPEPLLDFRNARAVEKRNCKLGATAIFRTGAVADLWNSTSGRK
jgi:SAM-dependent methyltransferase